MDKLLTCKNEVGVVGITYADVLHGLNLLKNIKCY